MSHYRRTCHFICHYSNIYVNLSYVFYDW